MKNCIVAQSGGPTSVINATVAGIVKGNQMNRVYGGLNGVEGILAEHFVDLSENERGRKPRAPANAVIGSGIVPLQDEA